MSIFGFLAYVLGPLMELLYKVIPNYAVTIIVFTVLIRVVSFPLNIKQQKSMAKMSVFTPMINEIQQKYKTNQEKMQQELMKLQQEYGYTPTAGCLPMALNMLVMFGIIEVVYRPVRYILGIPNDAITAAASALGLTANSVSVQTDLIQAIHSGTSVATGLSTAQFDTIKNFNTMFFGVDMCQQPGFRLSWLLIFPILATVTMIVTNVISTRTSGQQAQMQGSMKIMMWVMNAFFAYFCFTVPVGFSLYYATSNICMAIQTVIIARIYNPEKFKAQYEAEIAAKKAARKQKKEVVVEEDGQTVTRQVGEADLNKLRLERARAMDAEKYSDERTVPLTAEQLQQELDGQKKKRR
jgi:YidC/Oxa1 family membrane protein insertase